MEEKIFTVTTSSGFEYHVDKDALDDMEIFEDLMTMEDQNASKPEKMRATNRAFRKLIGDEQKTQLDSYLKQKDGRVRISAYQREIVELFRSLNEDKKK